MSRLVDARPPAWAVAAAVGLHVVAWQAWRPWISSIAEQPAAVGEATRLVALTRVLASAEVVAPSAAKPSLAAARGDAAQTADQRPSALFLKENQSLVPEFVASDATKTGVSASEAAAPQSGLRAAKLPPSLQLHYTVHNQRGDMPFPARPARAMLQWKNEGGSYELQLDVERWFGGPRTLRSTGQISEAGLAPQRYSEKARAEIAAHLDASAGTVRFSNNRPEAKLEDGIQDRLSIVMQLSAWLAANPTQVPLGGQIALPAVGLGETNRWVFEVKAADAGELAPHVWSGQGQVRKLSAQQRHDFDAKLDIWLGESTQPSPWLPLAIRLQRPNGDWMLIEIANQADTRPLQMEPPPPGGGPGGPGRPDGPEGPRRSPGPQDGLGGTDGPRGLPR